MTRRSVPGATGPVLRVHAKADREAVDCRRAASPPSKKSGGFSYDGGSAQTDQYGWQREIKIT